MVATSGPTTRSRRRTGRIPRSRWSTSVRTPEAKILGEWSWDQRRKTAQSTRSQSLRWYALLLSIVGGLVPLLTALFSRPDWPWFTTALGWINFGQLGYVLLAIAAGCVLLDRYFGYSTSWMRYVVAMQAIERRVRRSVSTGRCWRGN